LTQFLDVKRAKREGGGIAQPRRPHRKGRGIRYVVLFAATRKGKNQKKRAERKRRRDRPPNSPPYAREKSKPRKKKEKEKTNGANRTLWLAPRESFRATLEYIHDGKIREKKPPLRSP